MKPTRSLWIHRHKKRSLFAFAILLIELAQGVYGQTHTETAREIEALKGLSIEQLSAIDITSVSKRSERLIDSPSAIQVKRPEEGSGSQRAVW